MSSEAASMRWWAASGGEEGCSEGVPNTGAANIDASSIRVSSRCD